MDLCCISSVVLFHPHWRENYILITDNNIQERGKKEAKKS